MSGVDVDKTDQMTICCEDILAIGRQLNIDVSPCCHLFYGLERSSYFPQLELIANLSPVFDNAFRPLHWVRTNSKTILLMTTDKWQVVAALKDAD